MCIADGCTVPSRNRGYCATHYSRLKNWGTLDTTGRRTFRKCKPGDTRLEANGYVRVKAPGHSEANSNGWAFEHRYVMANHLGRPLKATENIHHINGDRADNRIENLEIWNTIQPSGQRAQDKIDFAIYILKLYCPDRLAA